VSQRIGRVVSSLALAIVSWSFSRPAEARITGSYVSRSALSGFTPGVTDRSPEFQALFTPPAKYPS
jgi:hypothetical protein